MNKNEVVDFINRNPVFSLATCINNIPYVRNMLTIKVSESEVVFNVKKYKPVYQPSSSGRAFFVKPDAYVPIFAGM